MPASVCLSLLDTFSRPKNPICLVAPLKHTKQWMNSTARQAPSDDRPPPHLPPRGRVSSRHWTVHVRPARTPAPSPRPHGAEGARARGRTGAVREGEGVVMGLIERWVCTCPEHGIGSRAYSRPWPRARLLVLVDRRHALQGRGRVRPSHRRRRGGRRGVGRPARDPPHGSHQRRRTSAACAGSAHRRPDPPSKEAVAPYEVAPHKAHRYPS